MAESMSKQLAAMTAAAHRLAHRLPTKAVQAHQPHPARTQRELVRIKEMEAYQTIQHILQGKDGRPGGALEICQRKLAAQSSS